MIFLILIYFQLHVGFAEFYVGQMRYVAASDDPNLGVVILGSCAGGAVILIVVAVVLLLLGRKSRRFRDFISTRRQKKRMSSSSAKETGVTNAGFLIDFDLPQLKRDRDTVIFTPARGGDGGDADVNVGGSDQNATITDEYLTPPSKGGTASTDGHLAPSVKQ